MSLVDPQYLALQRLYHWEQTAPDRVALTQPMGHGVEIGRASCRERV